MFEGLEWKNAFKRASIIFAVWLFSVYALSIAFPDTFNLGFESGAGIIPFAINAVFFFFFFVVFTAFIERSKKRNAARLRTSQKASKKDKPSAKTEPGAAEDEEVRPDTLKGRHNPNTSRKKATRRRR